MKKTKQQIIDELKGEVKDLKGELTIFENDLEKETEAHNKQIKRNLNIQERKDEETRQILAELVEILPYEVRSEYHKHYTLPKMEFGTKVRPGGLIPLEERGEKLAKTIKRLQFAIAYGIGNLVSRTDIDTNSPKQNQS